MAAARSPLGDDAESVLLALHRESSVHPRPPVARVASRSGLTRQQFEAGLAQLEEHSLVDGRLGTGTRSIALTHAGHETVRGLKPIEAMGPVQEFRRELSSLQVAILNVVAEYQLRVAGGSVTRSHVRTVVRQADEPGPEVERINEAIDFLSGTHLEVLGGVEPVYRTTLRGLLASDWGRNAFEVVDGTRSFLAQRKAVEPSLFRYSWGELSRHIRLPPKGLNLVYIAIAAAGLGNGLFESEGDSWWSTPKDLDLLVEGPTLAYIHGALAPEPAKVSRDVPQPLEVPIATPRTPDLNEEAAARLSRLVDRVTAMLEPSENPTTRLQEAFERLTLHPAIAGASGEMFRSGHYRNAVLDAGIALVNYVKDRSGRADLDGSTLMEHVFSLNDPTLAFNKRRTQSEKDEQQGLMRLFAGAVQGVRNPRAHSLVPDDGESALECIVLFSLLARRVDRAKRIRKKRRPRRGGEV